jgi:hypothetical protein
MRDINKGKDIKFRKMSKILGVRNKFQASMAQGYNLSSVFYSVVKKVENLIHAKNLILDKNHLQSFYENLSLFDKVNDLRNQYYASLLEYASHFQKEIHQFFENFFNSNFISEKPAIELFKTKIIKIKGKKIRIHHNLKFDGYCKLNPSIRNRFGLKEDWKGIIFEAHGMWHVDRDIFLRMFPYKTESDFKRRLKVDKLKRILCRIFNYILIEIYEDMDEDQWEEEILRQISIQQKNY